MRVVPFLFAAALVACNPSGSAEDFTSGDFQLTTQDVDDGCLDGGMEALFMPEGTPNDFANAIYLPAEDELPATYDVDIQDPFNDMEVTVTGDDDTRTVTGAENNGVEFDADAYPGCLIDNSIDVDLTIFGIPLNTVLLHVGKCYQRRQRGMQLVIELLMQVAARDKI